VGTTTFPLTDTLPPNVVFPVADTVPAIVTFPATSNDTNDPTLVRLEPTTLLAIKVPVNPCAFEFISMLAVPSNNWLLIVLAVASLVAVSALPVKLPVTLPVTLPCTFPTTGPVCVPEVPPVTLPVTLPVILPVKVPDIVVAEIDDSPEREVREPPKDIVLLPIVTVLFASLLLGIFPVNALDGIVVSRFERSALSI